MRRWLQMLLVSLPSSYKDNYRREGIRVANARPKVVIFCKSRWDLVTVQWFYAVRAFRRRMFCTVNRISCCEWFTTVERIVINCSITFVQVDPVFYWHFACNFSWVTKGGGGGKRNDLYTCIWIWTVKVIAIHDPRTKEVATELIYPKANVILFSVIAILTKWLKCRLIKWRETNTDISLLTIMWLLATRRSICHWFRSHIDVWQEIFRRVHCHCIEADVSNVDGSGNLITSQ